MQNKSNWRRNLIICLFILYLLLLTWVILFKMQFSIEALQVFHGTNFIPFAAPSIAGGGFEIAGNILAFIPYGIFICMVKGHWTFIQKSLSAAALSFFYEATQFLLGIGATDITDLILNTFGGILGIGLYHAMLMMVRTRPRVANLLKVLALVGITCALFLILALL